MTLNSHAPKVAIVDYALGNLYSIKHACKLAGLDAIITSSREDILSSDGVILPGMGAFGEAMRTLKKLDLVSVLRDYAASERPLMGVCLGIQLLLSESFEFGHHQGIGLIEGEVIPLDHPSENGRMLKIPQVGWNQINSLRPWKGSPLEDVSDHEYMYFVHSFVPRPANHGIVLSSTNYGGIEFCSSLHYKNIFACLFHPERSGNAGLKIYQQFAATIKQSAGTTAQ